MKNSELLKALQENYENPKAIEEVLKKYRPAFEAQVRLDRRLFCRADRKAS